MKNEWFEEIKEDIIVRLEENKGREEYVCDMGYMLTEYENCNGSWYCSAPAARDEIGEHLEEFGAIAEYMKYSLGIETNPLLESETFHCQALITVYETTFAYAAGDIDYDGQTEITAEFIEAIREKLKTINFEALF